MKHARVTWSAAVLVGLITSTASRDAAAANEIALGAAYDARAPLGSLRRLTPDASFGGFQAKWDFYPIDALATGFEVQYNIFQRSPTTDTLALADGALTGTTFRYASFWSILPTVRYYLFAHSALRPYGELGAGVVGVTSAVLVSDQSQREINNGFIFQPSVGILWRLTSEHTPSATDDADSGYRSRRAPLESMFGLTASATYAFTTADVIAANNVSYAGFQIGIYAKP